MSITSAISNAQQRVANAYTSVSTMGGTLPATQDLSHLPTAIESIPSGDEVTISGTSVPSGQKALIRFDTSKQPYLADFYNAYTYTGISNGDTTFKTALPTPLPYLQNYTVNGTVTISDDLKGTGWSASDYLSGIIEPMNEIDLEFIGKIKWSSGTTVRIINSLLGISERGLFTYFNSGNNWDRPATTRSISSTQTWYWVRIRVINSVAIAWFIVDNNYTEETLPDIDSWTGVFVNNVSTEGLNLAIGKVIGSNGSAYNNDMDLSTFKIYQLNTTNHTKSLIWQMYSPFSLTISDMTKYIPSGDWDVRKGQGTPIIATKPLGFSKGLNDFHIDSSTNLYPCAKTFRWNLSNAKSIYIKSHFKTPSSWVSNAHQPLLAYTTNTWSNPVTVYRDYSSSNLSGTFGILISSISTNTEYWIEATLDNQGNRVQKYSTDGVNWTTTSDTVTAPTWTDYTDVPSVGYWGNANFYWSGIIYDLECGYVDANDETHTFKLWK